MKLILENWRKFLSEGSTGRLSVFDFDETIAFTDSYVDAYDKKTGEFIESIYSPQKQRQAKESGLYNLDFGAYDEVSNPSENKKITDIIRDRLSDSGTQVVVLTARTSDSEDDIHTYLSTLEPPIDASKVFIKGVAGEDKGQHVLSILQKLPHTSVVEFYDDSKENINAMIRAKQEVEGIDSFKIYQVIEGEPRLIE